MFVSSFYNNVQSVERVQCLMDVNISHFLPQSIQSLCYVAGILSHQSLLPSWSSVQRQYNTDDSHVTRLYEVVTKPLCCLFVMCEQAIIHTSISYDINVKEVATVVLKKKNTCVRGSFILIKLK